MAMKAFGVSFGTSWFPLEDEEEELFFDGFASLEDKDGGDGEG